MPINTPSTRYTELEEIRYLPRQLMKGTKAMRLAGEELTPRHPAETKADYNLRIRSTTLYCALADSIKKMVGKVFSKPVIANEDVPPQITALLKNFDGQGRNITSFSLDVFKEAMVDGVSYIFVDFPKVETNDNGFATALDQQLQGARPSAILVKATDLIGIKSANINGYQQLTEARIKETIIENDPADEYVDIEIQQIRLLIRGGYELWRKTNSQDYGDEWFLYESGTTSIDYIPLVPVYTNRTGFFEGEPPLLPLAELNLEHWISSGEQRHALTLARFAMMVFTGVDGDTDMGKVSANTVFKLPDPSSKWGLVETSGNGITQGFVDLEKIKELMQHCGMSIRVQQNSADVTATAASIDSQETDSALMAAALSLENSLNQVLDMKADYLGLPNGGTINVNAFFAAVKPDGTSEDILRLYIAGGLLSKEDALVELKRRNVLAEDLDIKGVLQRANDESMMFSGG